MVAPKLSEALGQSVVIDNRAGAGSIKDLVALAKSRPNQLTFGSGGVGTPLHR